jgi:hypothetical protein
MRHRHQVSSTTHTVEMAQIAEINDGLREHESSHAIPASLLGMQGVKLAPGNDDDDDSRLPGEAFLTGLSFDGPPEFPYVHGHFRTDLSDQVSLTVDLHTDALRKLSQLLGLQHIWG